MCIAILKTKNSLITDEEIINSFNNNPDGAGFGFFYDGKPKVFKPYFTLDEFLQAWKKAYKEYMLDKRDVILHFRIATHGGLTKENTHPFLSKKNSIIAHNGIISGLGDKVYKQTKYSYGSWWGGKDEDTTKTETQKKSDTVEFIENYINKLPAKFYRNLVVKDLVENRIDYSKIIVLNKDEYCILNESNGHWHGGNWYSNKSYETKKVTKYTPPKWNKSIDYGSDYKIWKEYSGWVYLKLRNGIEYRNGNTILNGNSEVVCKLAWQALDYSTYTRTVEYNNIIFKVAYSSVEYVEKFDDKISGHKFKKDRKYQNQTYVGTPCIKCGDDIGDYNLVLGFDKCVNCLDEEEYKDLDNNINRYDLDEYSY